MSTPAGWQPLSVPGGSLRSRLDRTGFGFLARAHAVMSAGDGAIAAALAGSIFFAVQPGAARWRVALYLVLTIAPFAVVTPLIGPVIDRAKGGRRGMIVATLAGRAVLAFLMMGRMDSLLLFPAAFGMLVLQKGYAVASRAVVPTLVDNERQLVEANSKLSLLSSIGGMAGAAVSAGIAVVLGPSAAVFVALVLFAVAVVPALQMPPVVVAAEPEGATETAEVHGPGIILGAQSIAVLRALVGFLSFLVAFEFRGGRKGVDLEPLGAAAGAGTGVLRKLHVLGDPAAPAWHFGVVVGAAGIGALIGARVAPRLRRSVSEEQIILGVLAITGLCGLVAAWRGGLFGAALVSLAVAVAAGAGKLAFDSLVQRDAPDANYGRTFARFEARFQLAWAAGAFVPVVLKLPAWFGYLVIGLLALGALGLYVQGNRRVRVGKPATLQLRRPRRGPATAPSTAPATTAGDAPPLGSGGPPPSPPQRVAAPAATAAPAGGPSPDDPTLVDVPAPGSRPSARALDPTLVDVRLAGGDPTAPPSPPARPAPADGTRADRTRDLAPADRPPAPAEPPARSDPTVWPQGLIVTGGPGVEIDAPAPLRPPARPPAPRPGATARPAGDDADDTTDLPGWPEG